MGISTAGVRWCQTPLTAALHAGHGIKFGTVHMQHPCRLNCCWASESLAAVILHLKQVVLLDVGTSARCTASGS